MEQKKILWIFSILTAFLLLVFAVAWYFYSPARRQNSSKITKLEETQAAPKPALASVDPDAWAKNTEHVPTPNSQNPPVINIDNTVTLVNGGKELDVTGLVADNKTIEGELPASISNELRATVKPASSDDKNKESAKEVDARVPSNESKKEETAQTSPTKTVKPTGNTVAAKTTVSKKTNTAKTKKTTAKTTTPQKVYWVQTASLTSRLYAEEARKRLQEKNFKAEIFTKDTAQGLVHRVRVGPFENKTEANYWLSSIKKLDGFEGSFVSEEKVN